MIRTVLVSFDIDSKRAPTSSYLRAYMLLETFGMKDSVSNHTNDVALPSTTVIGEVEMEPSTTPMSMRDRLRELFSQESIPITHLVVAFIDCTTSAGFAGIGQVIETS